MILSRAAHRRRFSGVSVNSVNSRQRTPRQRKSRKSRPCLPLTPTPATPYHRERLRCQRTAFFDPAANRRPEEHHPAPALEVVLSFAQSSGRHQVADGVLRIGYPVCKLTNREILLFRGDGRMRRGTAGLRSCPAGGITALSLGTDVDEDREQRGQRRCLS